MLNKTKDITADRRQARNEQIQDALIAGETDGGDTELEDVVR